MSNLAIRFFSAVVLVVVALGMTWLGGPLFAVFAALVSGLILHEFFRITESGSLGQARIAGWACLVLVLATWFVWGPQYSVAALAATAPVVFLFEVVNRRRPWAAIGLCYAALPFLALAILRGSSTNGLIVLLIIFAIVWGSDIAAYFAGRTFGGPKLAPAISPNKTWSGAVGGLVGAMALAAVVSAAFVGTASLVLLVFSAVVSVVSQVGDLFESWVKRRFGVKDSGSIIPGHGGVLDRLDGLIFASVAVWLLSLAFGADLLEPENAASRLADALLVR